MEKVKLYILFGLIVFVGLLTLTGCTGERTIDYKGGTYTGEVKYFKPHGQGTLTFVNDAKYIGEFKDGKRHGQGTFTSPDGTVKSGRWEDGDYIGP